METAMIFIGIAYLILRPIIKEIRDDIWVRNKSRENGWDFYYSSTGKRRTSDNQPYYKHLK